MEKKSEEEKTTLPASADQPGSLDAIVSEDSAPKPEEPKEEEKKQEASNNKNKKKNIIAYIIILVLVAAAAAVIILDYSKISSFLKSKVNPYGFDFSYNRIKQYDWDTILTEKKIAGVWNTSRKNINSAKNPDWSWILEDPAQLVDEAGCATMLDEKILDQENADKKNLLNVSILLCKNTTEAKTTFASRKDEIKNVSQTDNTVTIKSMSDTKGLGDEGYTYLIEKAAAKEGDPADKFAGTVFRQGPFMIMIDESEQQGTSYLSTGDMELKIAKHLDKELKKLLSPAY